MRMGVCVCVCVCGCARVCVCMGERETNCVYLCVIVAVEKRNSENKERRHSTQCISIMVRILPFCAFSFLMI